MNDPEKESVLLIPKYIITYKEYEYLTNNDDCLLLKNRINLLTNQIDLLSKTKLPFLKKESLDNSLKENLKNNENEFNKTKECLIKEENKKEELRKKLTKIKEIFEKIKEKNNFIKNKKSEIERELVFLTGKIEFIKEEMSDEIKSSILEEINLFNDTEINSDLLEMALTNKNELVKLIDKKIINYKINEKEEELNENIKNIKEEIDLLIPFLEVENDNKIKEILNKYDILKKELNEIKKELDTVKKERSKKFMDCFTFISSKIHEIYKKLMNEDCNSLLTLENKSDLLNLNIKYFVMPPKKRFRDVNELSGGEKSMACLALILTLKEFKRPPFLYLMR